MIKNTIHSERIKSYFLQAAMEILRGEGIRDLSVRHVAEKAGYSYATLYNHYKDLNALLTACIQEFLNESKSAIDKEILYVKRGKQRLALIYYSFIKYFVQYPGIFELVFLQKPNMESRELILNFINDLTKEDWNHLVEENVFSKQAAAIKKENAEYLTVGLLLFYNNLRFPSEYIVFEQAVKNQFSNLLEL